MDEASEDFFIEDLQLVDDEGASQQVTWSDQSSNEINPGTKLVEHRGRTDKHGSSESDFFIGLLEKEGVVLDETCRELEADDGTSLDLICLGFLKSLKTHLDEKDLHLTIFTFLKFLLREECTGKRRREKSGGNVRDSRAAGEVGVCDTRVESEVGVWDTRVDSEVGDGWEPGLNINNHRIANMSMAKKMSKELERVRQENCSLTAENYELRNNIRVRKKIAAAECAKILRAIIRYCEARAECAAIFKASGKCDVPAICRDNSRLGAGCSKGGCGGYTPSGWNKLMTKCRLMQEQEAECTCTPCTPCPPKRKPRCKPNPCADASNSQGAPNDESEDKKKRPSLKILGELAFQLERRILDYVFGMEDTKRKRFYGYTVGNIFSMMERESKNPRGGSDAITKSELVCRLRKLMVGLEKYGYNIKFHAEFAQEIVNKYGLLACPPDQVTIEEFRLNDPLAISTLIQQLAQGPSEMSHLNVLLNSLVYLSNCDHRPLFIW